MLTDPSSRAVGDPLYNVDEHDVHLWVRRLLFCTNGRLTTYQEIQLHPATGRLLYWARGGQPKHVPNMATGTLAHRGRH
jgi:hypothetical protein